MKIPNQIIGLLVLSILPNAAHAAKTTDYPEVVAIMSVVSFDGRSESPGKCSGTFITPRLLLTAAHCVRHFNVFKLNGRYARFQGMDGRDVPDLTAGLKDVFIMEDAFWGPKEIHPVRVHVSESAVPIETDKLELDYVDQDLAILEFGADYSAKTRKVADRTPTTGTPVTIVGFGAHGDEAIHGSSGFGGTMPNKFFGRNALDRVELDAMSVNGSPVSCEYDQDSVTNDWATCSGDSGGPIINTETNEIIGVTSASGILKHDPKGRPGPRKISIFTDVTSSRAAAFIRHAIEITGKGLPPAPATDGRRGD